jgi:hypothetical protein
MLASDKASYVSGARIAVTGGKRDQVGTRQGWSVTVGDQAW